MDSFKSDLENLYEGINVAIPNEDPIIVRGVILCGTCDLPAKALFMNVKQYNGIFVFYNNGYCPNCKYKTSRMGRVALYLSLLGKFRSKNYSSDFN